MPDASVDAIVTDPPYSSGGAFRGDRLVAPSVKYIDHDPKNQKTPTFAGDTRDGFGFWYWMSMWLSESLRVVKPGGVAAVFTDWRQIALTIGSLQSGGWVYRGIANWHKPNARPIRGRYNNTCEYVVWGTSGPRSLDALGPTSLPGLWTECAPLNREHMTQKPLGVMCGLVEIVPPGGIVLDPFAGSGTTGVACVQKGRSFIGIEREAAYVDIARRRIADAQAQTTLGVA
jgi:site-specific DNA-methyltransferase (adenine-specific)